MSSTPGHMTPAIEPSDSEDAPGPRRAPAISIGVPAPTESGAASPGVTGSRSVGTGTSTGRSTRSSRSGSGRRSLQPRNNPFALRLALGGNSVHEDSDPEDSSHIRRSSGRRTVSSSSIKSGGGAATASASATHGRTASVGRSLRVSIGSGSADAGYADGEEESSEVSSTRSIPAVTPVDEPHRHLEIRQGGVKALGLRIGQALDSDEDTVTPGSSLAAASPSPIGLALLETDQAHESDMDSEAYESAARRRGRKPRGSIGDEEIGLKSKRKEERDLQKKKKLTLKLAAKAANASSVDSSASGLGEKALSLRISVPQRPGAAISALGSQTAPTLRIDTSGARVGFPGAGASAGSGAGGTDGNSEDVAGGASGGRSSIHDSQRPPRAVIHRAIGRAVPKHRGPSTPRRMSLPAFKAGREKMSTPVVVQTPSGAEVRFDAALNSPTNQHESSPMPPSKDDKLTDNNDNNNTSSQGGGMTAPPSASSKKYQSQSNSGSVGNSKSSASLLSPDRRREEAGKLRQNQHVSLWIGPYLSKEASRRKQLSIEYEKKRNQSGGGSGAISASSSPTLSTSSVLSSPTPKEDLGYWLYKEPKDLNLLIYWRLKTLSEDNCHPLHFFAETWEWNAYKKALKQALSRARREKRERLKRALEEAEQRRVHQAAVDRAKDARERRGSNSSRSRQSQSGSVLSMSGIKGTKSNSKSTNSSSDDDDDDGETEESSSNKTPHVSTPQPLSGHGSLKGIPNVAPVTGMNTSKHGSTKSNSLNNAFSTTVDVLKSAAAMATPNSNTHGASAGHATNLSVSDNSPAVTLPSRFQKHHKEFQKSGKLSVLTVVPCLTAMIRSEIPVKSPSEEEKMAESQDIEAGRAQAAEVANGATKLRVRSGSRPSPAPGALRSSLSSLNGSQGESLVSNPPYSLLVFESVPKQISQEEADNGRGQEGEDTDVPHLWGFVKSHSLMNEEWIESGFDERTAAQMNSDNNNNNGSSLYRCCGCSRLCSSVMPSLSTIVFYSVILGIYLLALLERIYFPIWSDGLLDFNSDRRVELDDNRINAEQSCVWCLAVTGRIMLVSVLLLAILPLIYLHRWSMLGSLSMISNWVPNGNCMLGRFRLVCIIVLVVPMITHLCCLILPAILAGLNTADLKSVSYEWYADPLFIRRKRFIHLDAESKDEIEMEIRLSIVGDGLFGLGFCLCSAMVFLITSMMSYRESSKKPVFRAAEKGETLSFTKPWFESVNQWSAIVWFVSSVLYAAPSNGRLWLVFSSVLLVWMAHRIHCSMTSVLFKQQGSSTVISELNVVPIDKHFEVVYFHHNRFAECPTPSASSSLNESRLLGWKTGSFYLSKVRTVADNYYVQNLLRSRTFSDFMEAVRELWDNGVSARLKHECVVFDVPSSDNTVGCVLRLHATHYEGKTERVKWNNNFVENSIGDMIRPVLRGPYPCLIYDEMESAIFESNHHQNNGGHLYIHIGIDEGVSYLLETMNALNRRDRSLVSMKNSDEYMEDHVLVFSTCSVALLRYVSQSLSLLFTEQPGLTVEARLSQFDFTHDSTVDLSLCAGEEPYCEEFRNVLGVSHIDTALSICQDRDWDVSDSVTVLFCGLKNANRHLQSYCDTRGIRLISHCVD